ncbi:hypothetical protein NKG94_40180 [Micromonospora sp. M12]
MSRQVARLLQERMGLAAAPQNVPGLPTTPPHRFAVVPPSPGPPSPEAPTPGTPSPEAPSPEAPTPTRRAENRRAPNRRMAYLGVCRRGFARHR